MEKKYPEIAVGALIHNHNNEILLGRTHKWKGRWCVPGGHIELGESFEQAVKREIKEETNLDIKDIKLFNTDECIFSDDFHKKKHFIFLNFVCKASEIKDLRLNKEFQEHIWVKPEESLKMDLSDSTKIFIEKVIQKRK